MRAMANAGLPLDEFGFNAVINACARAADPAGAEYWLQEMF